MALPDCLDCKYGGREHPCRDAAGHYDFVKAATAYIARGRQIAKDYAGEPSDAEDGDEDWISDCEFEIVQDHPDLILPFSIAAMDACETSEDAAWLAAGTIETALAKHGPELIGAIEALAARSAKVRYILSGVWSHGGSIYGDVWERVGRAVGGSGRISNDPREASDGSEPVVLDEAEAAAVLTERVGNLARELNLGG